MDDKLINGKVYLTRIGDSQRDALYVGRDSGSEGTLSRDVVTRRKEDSRDTEAYKFNRFTLLKNGTLILKRPYKISLSEYQKSYIESLLNEHNLC